MNFSEIISQEPAVRMLRASIQRSSVAHAYLFTGSKSTGKTSTALAFAAALNCADPTPDGDACGHCISCVRIQAGDDMDVRLISPDGNQTKIPQMQEMIKDLNFAPLSGRYKIFIIEQADTLNPNSENCILKVLEEPPSYAVLILLSSNPNSLLPTIRSRCRTVRFRRAGTSEIEDILSKRFDLADDAVRMIAACSQGSVGRAFRLASSPEFMEERQAVLQTLKSWADGPAVRAIQSAEILRGLAEPQKNDPDSRTRTARLAEMLEHILSWYADLLALKVRGENSPVSNADCAEELQVLSSRFSAGRLRKSVGVIMDTRRYLDGNITPQLALENMFFDIQPDIR